MSVRWSLTAVSLPTVPRTGASGGIPSRSRTCSSAAGVREEVLQRNARGDDAVLLGQTHAEAEVLAAAAFGQGDDPVGESGAPSLQRQKETGHDGTEVSVEDVSVGRVDDDGRPGPPGGHPADNSGLRGMGVNDIEPAGFEEAIDSGHGANVLRGPNRPHQAGERDNFDPFVPGSPLQGARRLSRLSRALQNTGPNPFALKAENGEQGVVRGTAPIQPGDDVTNPDDAVSGFGQWKEGSKTEGTVSVPGSPRSASKPLFTPGIVSNRGRTINQKSGARRRRTRGGGGKTGSRSFRPSPPRIALRERRSLSIRGSHPPGCPGGRQESRRCALPARARRARSPAASDPAGRGS